MTSQGGYDSGQPDRVPDLIQFNVDASAPRRDRSESSGSYHMDPEHIQRVAHPHSEELYTVVSRAASSQKDAEEPPYMNQPSISPAPSHEKPVVYRKSPVHVQHCVCALSGAAYNTQHVHVPFRSPPAPHHPHILRLSHPSHRCSVPLMPMERMTMMR